LYKDIYLDDNLYNKNNPVSYYRYLKEFQNESLDVKNNIKLNKLKNILLHFFDNLNFYKTLLLETGIDREKIENIKTFDLVKELPVLNKQILKKNFEEIKKLSI
jgi:phenylacetate-coenzyme A ligase PaaK-like adenylate-forming protein